MKKLMLLYVATSVLSGCVTAKETVVPDSSCAAYKIIRPSQDDTIDTKRQVLVHNTTYRRICGVK